MSGSLKGKVIILMMIFFALFSLFLIVKNINQPLVGIFVLETNDGKVIVSDIYNFGWAMHHDININDVIIEVDGKDPLSHFTVPQYQEIEQAHTLTIQRGSEIKHFIISHSPQLAEQYLFYVFLPTTFLVCMLGLSLFLYRSQGHEKRVRILIYFLLLLGLCYLSASLSAKLDVLGQHVLSLTFLLTPVVFLHFIYLNFQADHKVWFNKKLLFALYAVSLASFLTTVVHPWLDIHIDDRRLLLATFLLLIAILLFLLGKGLRSLQRDLKQKTIKGILWALGVSLAPFVFLYALPMALIEKSIIPAELAIVFIFVLPAIFLYLLCTDRLFQLQFTIHRLSYYGSLAFFPALIVTLIDFWFMQNNNQLIDILQFFFLIYAASCLLLFVKAYLDRKLRAKLFPEKKYYQESLYRVSERLKKHHRLDQVVESIKHEVKDVIGTKNIFHAELAKDGHAVSQHGHQGDTTWLDFLEKVRQSPLQIGTILQHKLYFAVVIGESQHSYHLLLGQSYGPLNGEQKDWLSTIAYYTSLVIENLLKMEDIMKELAAIAEKPTSRWASRLLFKWSEKERQQLAIDLHDTILQELLLLKRKTEKLRLQSSDELTQMFHDIEEQLLDTIYLTRETCHQLRPPFLAEMGLKEALLHLQEKFQLRSNILLELNVDKLANQCPQEVELVLYRIIQELLNNAQKHSKASHVTLYLSSDQNQIQLHYVDDGIGMDMENINAIKGNIGLFGIKARVLSLDGKIEYESAPGQGFTVHIHLPYNENEWSGGGEK
ncbi:histidine kinase [Caldalkalibacillus thermarum]|uniref:sensor histidine kinase n=1 Tax=Caldalkalibacillus thermarum TaxID=296745 RepID=UPI00166B7404|nr:sensor histidine kinase [Caldalkalibacillus thermarum]GGK28669.1 histidine kinase [Caldalkalibacillus thermarum]